MARALYKNLTVQVLAAIVVGMLLGYFRPDWGKALKPVADGFINLVKMVVAPIVFLTIVVGIASMGDLKKVGRVGLKALIYFEVVTTVALAIGLLVANGFKPGVGVHATAAPTTQVAKYTDPANQHSLSEFLLNIIPDNIVNAFAKGDLLQILLFAILFGIALASLGDRKLPLMDVLEHLTEVMFRIVALIMKVAPLGAMAAMAYTIGMFGLASLKPLAMLLACVYLTMAVFVFVVLWGICRAAKFSLWGYMRFIREEILLVVGTSSSEPALPRMMEKLERMGCSRGVVGLVIPAGYSFNLDGTSIYLSLAALFITQWAGVQMSFEKQLSVMLVLMLTSKGAAAVTGGGFITLAATLTSLRVLPDKDLALGLGLLLGVDRFMSLARALTNLIGNGVATIVVSKMEGEFDSTRYEAAMSGRPPAAPAGGFPVEITADSGRPANADVVQT